jgi:DNA-binding beta-propeller fold protein YncE
MLYAVELGEGGHPLMSTNRSRTASFLLVVAALQACTSTASPKAEDRLPTDTSPPQADTSDYVELILTIKGDPNLLNGPTDVVVDADGNIFVADSENDRIQVFDRTGLFLRMWGGFGDRVGQFNFNGFDSSGFGTIEVDGRGNVFVGDTFNFRIQRFDREGRFVTAWSAMDKEGTQLLSAVYGVAVDNRGNVYAMDTRRNEIIKFDLEGEPLARWGGRGAGEEQLDNPGQISVDSDGILYVADCGNNRIQLFGSEGEFMSKWGEPGAGEGRFDCPNDVAVAPDGVIYVADDGNDRIQVFDHEGDFLFTWGSTGSGDYEFSGPAAVAVGDDGRIYVVDHLNDRVQVFQRR